MEGKNMQRFPVGLYAAGAAPADEARAKKAAR
jgi:hypothetical protein